MTSPELPYQPDRLIVTDIGGVVLDGRGSANMIVAVANATGASLSSVDRFFREELNPLASSGLRDEPWVLNALSDRFGSFDHKAMARIARRETDPLLGVQSALAHFAAQAPIWVLSNYIGPWLRDTLTYRDLDGYFQRLFISSEIHARKPHLDAYRPVQAAWDGPPHTIAFVDDLPENLAAAQKLGWYTIRSDGNPDRWGAELDNWLRNPAVPNSLPDE